MAYTLKVCYTIQDITLKGKKTMAINWEVKEKSVGELVYTVAGEEWQKAQDKAFKKIASNLTVDGFRKGQAPKAILNKRISAAERQYQAVNDNANAWLLKALEEAGVTPISQPELDVRSIGNDQVEVIYRFAVKPEVKLGEYKGIEYTQENTEVSEDELNAEINRIRETFAEWVIKEGEAENGDTVNIDYEGFKDGVPFDGGKADGHDLVLGSNSFIPGFEEQLVGAKADDEKELNLKFPEDYFSKDLAGADVVFKVKVNEVKNKQLPEINDEFAKDFNAPGVETVEGLYDLVRGRLADQKKAAADQKEEAELLEKVSETAEIDIPDVMIQEEEQAMMQQFAQQISQYGISFDQWIKTSGQTAEQFAKGYEEDAKKAVRSRLVLEKIADLENIKADAEEVDKQINELIEQYSFITAENVNEYVDRSLVELDIRNRKALDFIKENAKAVSEENK